MNHLKNLPACMALGAMLATTGAQAQALIPQPTQATYTTGHFDLRPGIPVYINLKGRDAKFLKSYLRQTLSLQRFTRKAGGAAIQLVCTGNRGQARRAGSDATLQGYTLQVSQQGITLKAATPMGLFYGIQTLRQLDTRGRIACTRIEDSPRFVYRGLMLDCSRHFWKKDFILKQIDAMAYFKLDRLHLHLTDAGGWRLQIKRYPRLTTEGAYRTDRDWNAWWNEGVRTFAHAGEPGAYGGFYTQREMRDIVAYAAARHITVIPEIEMPGHSNEVSHAYPELACVGQQPGRHGDLCVGNEKTFKFFEGVLKEVMKIFPSEYIHIGGDEAGRDAWAKCPLCQKRMADENIGNTAELQSYLTARIERFLNKHGRQLLGWDEILEGRLAPRAAVMSWRGEAGGRAAAEAGHHVVMSPGTYCYLDQYQDAPAKEPRAQSTYVPLSKTYSYDPVPANMAHTSLGRFIDGVQGNLWTEYVETEQHAEYMIYPRAMALAEVGWSHHRTPYDAFRERALTAIDTLRHWGYNTFDLRHEQGPRPEAAHPWQHLARGAKVTYRGRYSANYAAAGDTALTDGLRGNWNFRGGPWQGFIDAGRLDATIDLGRTIDISKVQADFLQSAGAQIYLPTLFTLSVSEDGEHFTQLTHLETPLNKQQAFEIRPYQWQGKARARYIRVQAGQGPEGGWVFTDEVMVY